MGKNINSKEQTPVSAKTQKVGKHKSVKIKHHHAMPYRKRHIVGFIVSFICGLSLILLVANYNSQLKSGLQSAKNFVTGKPAVQQLQTQTVSSDYGFSITYDPQQLYASGLDTSTGELFIGSELAVSRPYEVLRISPTLGGVSADSSNMTVRYYPKNNVTDPNNLVAVESAAIKDLTAKATLVAKKVGTSNVQLGGKAFLKSEWQFKSESKLLAGITASFTTYSGVLNNKALVIQVVNNTLTSQNSSLYDNVLASLYFGPARFTYTEPSKPVASTTEQNRNLLETLVFGQLASAQAPEASAISELTSAKYGPAVIKIFNVYCQDISYDGVLLIKDACSGGTGSGFFINPNGYIASNGHVTSSDPKDILIQFSYSYYKKGDNKLLDFLAIKAGVTVDDLPKGTTQERADYLFDRLYDLNSSRITTQNHAVNLLVALSDEVPNVKELIEVTNKRQQYAPQNTIKRASLVAQDFRSIDGFSKFHASDVSIIKVDGQDYPVAKLGTITTLMQGANLTILGYPGNASDNGIVDSQQSKVTLTSGKVSAIKNALGSTKKLIETDTLIGHGNSGGPAFNDQGEVVGISTYTATKVNDGTYNYVRDISDLIDLASNNRVQIDSKSQTQTIWEEALQNFNTARYSKAVKGFSAVKKLYPSHPKVDEFMFAANQNIANGKDVKEFPKLAVSIGAAVFIVLAGGAIVLMVRHKRAHNVYKTHVAEGKMLPLTKHDNHQHVQYDPSYIAAQKNVHTMTRHPVR